MKRYKAIIVEDERLPRLSLIQKLETYHPDIDIADSCSDYDTALRSILKHQPDILFLDIQLQGKTSIQLLEELQEGMELPYVIFTTAYNDNDYLLKAIKLAAVDYLFKPVNIIDLAQAIKKIKDKDQSGRPNSPEPEKSHFTNYNFRTVSGVLYANNTNILYCKADGNYSRLYLIQGNELILERLGDIEKKLDKQHFIRAGRSLIINKKYIYKIDNRNNLCYLKPTSVDCHKIEVSAGGIQVINELLNLTI